MRQLLGLFRQFRFWTKKSADADGHRFLWRTRVGVSALKVDEELRVRIIISKPLGDEQGQLRFADTAHAADASDASAAFTTQSIDQSVDFQLAANEVSHRRAKLMQCCSVSRRLDFYIASKDVAVCNITPTPTPRSPLAATVGVVSSGAGRSVTFSPLNNEFSG